MSAPINAAPPSPAVEDERADSVAPPLGIVARLTRGGASYAIATLLTRGMAFLLLPIYTRFLSPSDYGLVSLSETVAVAIPMVGGMGLSAALQRLYFKYDSLDARAATVATILRGALAWLLAMLSLGIVVGEQLIHLVSPTFSAPFFPFVALAFVTAAANQVIEYRQMLFQNQERSRAYAGLAIAGFVLNACFALVLVVGLRFGAMGLLLGKLLGAGTFAILSVVLLRNDLRGRWEGERMREAIKIGAPLVPHMFIALILGSADVLVIQAYRPVSEVGLYSVAYALGASASVVTSTLMLTWSPVFYDLVRHEGRDRAPVAQTSLLLTTVMLGAATIGTVLSPFVVPLILNSRFHASASLVPIVIGGYVFHWFFSLFHLALMQSGRSYLIAATTVSAAIVNMALNFVLIPRWGAVGAALATLVAYAVEAIAIYFMAQRYFRIPYPKGRILTVLAAYLMVLAATQAPLTTPQRNVLASLLGVATLALLYGVGGAARRST